MQSDADIIKEMGLLAELSYRSWDPNNSELDEVNNTFLENNTSLDNIYTS